MSLDAAYSTTQFVVAHFDLQAPQGRAECLALGVRTRGNRSAHTSHQSRAYANRYIPGELLNLRIGRYTRCMKRHADASRNYVGLPVCAGFSPLAVDECVDAPV